MYTTHVCIPSRVGAWMCKKLTHDGAYDSLLNSVQSCEQKSEVTSKITNVSEFTRKFSIASIASSFRHLKSGKASGVDGLAAEHLNFLMLIVIFMHICHYCSIAFCIMVIYQQNL